MLIIRKLLIFSIVYVGFELLVIMERLANHYVATECPVCRPLDDRIWNACKTWEGARSDAFLMSREYMLLVHATKYSVINVSGWCRSSLPWHNFRLLINESMYLSLWPLAEHQQANKPRVPHQCISCPPHPSTPRHGYRGSRWRPWCTARRDAQAWVVWWHLQLFEEYRDCGNIKPHTIWSIFNSFLALMDSLRGFAK